jgi:hypothetical protein
MALRTRTAGPHASTGPPLFQPMRACLSPKRCRLFGCHAARQLHQSKPYCDVLAKAEDWCERHKAIAGNQPLASLKDVDLSQLPRGAGKRSALAVVVQLFRAEWEAMNGPDEAGLITPTMMRKAMKAAAGTVSSRQRRPNASGSNRDADTGGECPNDAAGTDTPAVTAAVGPVSRPSGRSQRPPKRPRHEQASRQHGAPAADGSPGALDAAQADTFEQRARLYKVPRALWPSLRRGLEVRGGAERLVADYKADRQRRTQSRSGMQQTLANRVKKSAEAHPEASWIGVMAFDGGNGQKSLNITCRGFFFDSVKHSVGLRAQKAMEHSVRCTMDYIRQWRSEVHESDDDDESMDEQPPAGPRRRIQQPAEIPAAQQGVPSQQQGAGGLSPRQQGAGGPDGQQPPAEEPQRGARRHGDASRFHRGGQQGNLPAAGSTQPSNPAGEWHANRGPDGAPGEVPPTHQQQSHLPAAGPPAGLTTMAAASATTTLSPVLMQQQCPTTQAATVRPPQWNGEVDAASQRSADPLMSGTVWFGEPRATEQGAPLLAAALDMQHQPGSAHPQTALGPAAVASSASCSRVPYPEAWQRAQVGGMQQGLPLGLTALAGGSQHLQQQTGRHPAEAPAAQGAAPSGTAVAPCPSVPFQGGGPSTQPAVVALDQTAVCASSQLAPTTVALAAPQQHASALRSSCVPIVAVRSFQNTNSCAYTTVITALAVVLSPGEFRVVFARSPLQGVLVGMAELLNKERQPSLADKAAEISRIIPAFGGDTPDSAASMRDALTAILRNIPVFMVSWATGQSRVGLDGSQLSMLTVRVADIKR